VETAQPRADRAGAGALLRWSATGLAAALVLLLAFSEIGTVHRQYHNNVFIVRTSMVPAIDRVSRPGDCVLTDQVAYTILANRFLSDVPGCSLMDDPTGADLALSHGRTPSSGAGNVPAVAGRLGTRADDVLPRSFPAGGALPDGGHVVRAHGIRLSWPNAVGGGARYRFGRVM